ncbi:FAD-dependent oxidoreductase [Nocardioides sp. BP30]|uniref:NAD(P)/FAD-dependent oxidoreductase n=1 Tax=Nocardioides sp. BP30 TaxID=3036374 RepID=UPI002468FDA7|nr:FAD-dependent oxidoreductase [Nocardioides sp. BP30]WGL52478.1 FAD-dependent oxidoreductase [Nocardioides sp. BP30]
MTADRTGTLIVGASQAGVELAATLRRLGDDQPILLVGSEDRPPYQRPPLSKAYLAGKATAESLEFRTAQWYAEQRIDLRLSTKIERIELDAPTGGAGVATTRGGERLGFARLALTVGGRARRLAIPGADRDGVCYLRHVRNADHLRARLEAASDVVVIGGGFIGLEAAAAARAAGKEVTVVDTAERLLGRAVAPVVSEFYLHAHRRRGTHVLLGTGIETIEGAGETGTVTGVRLADGQVLPAQLVLIGVGLEPRTELAEQLGLEVDRGIVVDAYARTSNRAIVAAGDCTTLPHPLTGAGRIRIESVQNAIAQAQAAAAALVGRPSATAAVPWFWSDQDTLKLQIAGLSTGYDEVVVRGEPSSEQFSVLYYTGGRLIAVDAVNAPRDYMVVRKLLGEGGSIPADLAADATRPLKELLAASI